MISIVCNVLRRFYRDWCPPKLALSIDEYRRRRIYGDYYSLDQLDRKIEKYLYENNGFFVELGANDGVSQSNTLYFERKKGWRGILVEPTPHNYIKCRANRHPDNHIVCAACVSFDYNEKFVSIAYANLMSAPLGLESDVRDPMEHAHDGMRNYRQTDNVFTFGAQASTLSKIMLDANAPKLIDLLSLDVEGAEIEVLKGIDHDAFRFRYIVVECRNMLIMEPYLEGIGYALLEKLSKHDFLFKNVREMESDAS